MSYYWIGDKPIGSLVLVPTRAGSPIDLTLYSGVVARLIDPLGNAQALTAALSADQDAIEVQWPATALDTAPGLWQVALTLGAAGGRLERLDAVSIVVQADDGWHTLPSARSEWRDAPADDRQLYMLLIIAKTAVLAFAPELAPAARPPFAYRQAQLMQARNTWNAGRVDPASGGDGTDSFALTPFPLDWTIKQLLRPKTGRPVAL